MERIAKRQVLIIPNSVYLNPSNSRGLDRGSNSTPSKGNLRDYANINQLTWKT